MTKSENLANPNSCWNKALDDEEVFILLARDRAAVVAISAWMEERHKLGLNSATDPQILSTAVSIQKMEEQRLEGKFK